MKFNINQNVRVRLTDRGRAILRANFNRLTEGWTNAPDYEKVAPKEDADGWSKWQLWYLMQQFGANMAQGADLPFETEIEIIEEADPLQAIATLGTEIKEEVQYMNFFTSKHDEIWHGRLMPENLDSKLIATNYAGTAKLTFEDGKLISAEVAERSNP